MLWHAGNCQRGNTLVTVNGGKERGLRCRMAATAAARQGAGAQQGQAIQGGQHLHLGGLTPAERAEVMRQLRGGQ